MKLSKTCGALLLGLLLTFCLKSSVFAHEYAMSYLYGGTTTQYNNYVESSGQTLNAVSPDYLEINDDGSLRLVKIDSAFIANMHSKNKQVIPFISNHWNRDLGIAALNNTDQLTTQIAQAVNTYQLDGVNVDIENVTHLHKDAYTNFVKALHDKMPGKSISVAVAANPYNWQTGWHGSYDYAKLAQYCDHLVIMGYDESYGGGPAGPVASGSFAEKAIQYALTQTTADKLVLGMPFYGRYWKEGAASGGIGIAAMDIQNLTENYETTKLYHPDLQSAQLTLRIKDTDVMPKIWGGRTLDAGTYTIWYDDLNATGYKLDLVEKYKLKGSGSWALGQEVTSIWATYETYKTTAAPSPSVSSTPAATTTSVKYSSHIQNIDWETDSSRKDGQTTGTTGRSLRSEAIKIKLTDAPSGAGIAYQAHVQNIGWQDYVYNGTVAGTTGKSLRMEAIRIKLTGMPDYHIEYRSHIQNIGWTNWVRDGEISGTTGRSLRLEALEIRLASDTVKTTAPGETSAEASEKAADKGWFSDQEYDKNAITTRGDAVKIIMRMAINLAEPAYEVSDFADTANYPEKKFLRKAKYYGIIQGDENDRFYPDDPIVRKDFVMMMDRVFSLPDTVNFYTNRARDIDVTDSPDEYYAINKYLEHEIVDVDEQGNFRPYNTMTMGEIADITERMSGVGIKELIPIRYKGQQQPQKILEPR